MGRIVWRPILKAISETLRPPGIAELHSASAASSLAGPSATRRSQKANHTVGPMSLK